MLSPQRLRVISSSVAFGLSVGAGIALAPQPAAAQFFGRNLNNIIRGIVPGPRIYAPRPPRVYAPAGPRRSERVQDSSDGRPSARNDRLYEKLAPPNLRTQTAVLKGVALGAGLSAVGSTDDLNQVGQTRSNEKDRDYTSRLRELLERFERRQQRGTREGDVTEHSMQQSVNNAYKLANLQRFETFLGENWSTERLRVMILDRVDVETGALFVGTNRGLVSMADVDTIVQKAARSIYARLFETSELLAANRSAQLFVQQLYQVHGGAIAGDVREGAERMLMKAATAGGAPFEGLVRRDDNAYAFRYRMQRIIFDCLTENVERSTSSETGIAAMSEIEKRVVETEAQQCGQWIANQFVGPDGKLKAQEPMPLRAIWSAEGPKDDPSMYGRASGLL